MFWMIFMRYVDEYIQSRVNKKSQLHAYEIAEELWDLLKALDKKGCLRDKLRGEREKKLNEKSMQQLEGIPTGFLHLSINSMTYI